MRCPESVVQATSGVRTIDAVSLAIEAVLMGTPLTVTRAIDRLLLTDL